MSEKLSYREIAQRAGVSVMSVSNCLRQPARVRRETLEKVNMAVRALGGEIANPTRPSFRRLVAHRPFHRLRFIAFGVPKAVQEAPVYNRLIQSVIHEAGRLGFDISFNNLSEPGELDSGRLQDGIDALLLMGNGTINAPSTSCPVITLLSFEAPFSTDHVGYAKESVGKLVALHFLERKIRHAAYVGLGTGVRSGSFREAFIGGSRKRRCSIYGSPDFYQISNNEQLVNQDEIKRVSEALLADLPEAIFAHSDQLAVSLRDAMQRKSRKHCESVHWVGCNNDPPWRSMLGTGSCTVELGMKEIGRLAVERAVEVARHPGGMQQRLLIEPFLVQCA
jgi:LacI family transcriptional regulator